MRFTGTIEAKADAKGRVFFPAMFRKVLASAGEEQLVLSRDAFQPCLVLYPRSVWDEQLDSLRAGLSRWNARQQMIMREFVCDVETVTLDGGVEFVHPTGHSAGNLFAFVGPLYAPFLITNAPEDNRRMVHVSANHLLQHMALVIIAAARHKSALHPFRIAFTPEAPQFLRVWKFPRA